MKHTGSVDERSANLALAKAIATKLPDWEWNSEQRDMVEDRTLIPDFIFWRGSALVLGETKWADRDGSSNSTVEQDARKRIGLQIIGQNHPVEHCLAVRLPEELRSIPYLELENAFLESSNIQWSLLSQSTQGEIRRFPAKGWVRGDVELIADVIDATPLSERVLEKAYEILRGGVTNAAMFLMGLQEEERIEISKALFVISSDEDTMQMTSTIICNALLFQLQLEGELDNIRLEDCYLKTELPDWNRLRAAWLRIMDHNYIPIFRIALDALEKVPTSVRQKTLNCLVETARDLHSLEIVPSHDLVGRVFQGMYEDRQKLATYYTRPEAAALLGDYAVSMLDKDWSNLDEVKEIKVADFACGTGTLLTMTYKAIQARVRRQGMDPHEIHKYMMENSFIGLDVLPTATHMTTATLASNFPDVRFEDVRIATAPYGRDREGVVYFQDKERDSVFLGSLEFLALESGVALFDNVEQQAGTKDDVAETDSSRQTDTREEDGDAKTTEGSAYVGKEKITTFELPNYSVDIAIMNPPFSTQTHSQGDEIEPWAALDTTKEDQKRMSEKFKRIRGRFLKRFKFAGEGTAGIASNFFDLAFLKLKPGGVLAMVAPLTLVRGDGWNNTRKLLSHWFEDLTVFSIAAGDEGHVGTAQAFSADTGMSECLVVGVKRMKENESGEHDARSICLFGRPENLVEGTTLVNKIAAGGGGV